jgi:hypothetical protein
MPKFTPTRFDPGEVVASDDFNGQFDDFATSINAVTQEQIRSGSVDNDKLLNPRFISTIAHSPNSDAVEFYAPAGGTIVSVEAFGVGGPSTVTITKTSASNGGQTTDTQAVAAGIQLVDYPINRSFHRGDRIRFEHGPNFVGNLVLSTRHINVG